MEAYEYLLNVTYVNLSICHFFSQRSNYIIQICTTNTCWIIKSSPKTTAFIYCNRFFFIAAFIKYKAAANALSRLGENEYNGFTNFARAFTRWCKTGSRDILSRRHDIRAKEEVTLGQLKKYDHIVIYIQVNIYAYIDPIQKIYMSLISWINFTVYLSSPWHVYVCCLTCNTSCVVLLQEKVKSLSEAMTAGMKKCRKAVVLAKQPAKALKLYDTFF